jgi:hypothetical protein
VLVIIYTMLASIHSSISLNTSLSKSSFQNLPCRLCCSSYIQLVDAINSAVQISQVEEVFFYIRLESLCFSIWLIILWPAFGIRADLTQPIRIYNTPQTKHQRNPSNLQTLQWSQQHKAFPFLFCNLHIYIYIWIQL